MITDIKQLDLNKKYTYADYLKWSFQERVELLRGMLRKMSPAPSEMHQRISINLSTLFSIFLKGKVCQVRHAPYDVRLLIPSDTPISGKRRKRAKNSSDETIQTVVQPDIVIICDPNKIDQKGCLGAPDVVVEILSEGNNQDDLVEKFSIYESAAIPEYWIIHPAEESLIIYTLNSQGRYVGSKPYAPGAQIKDTYLEGLELAVAEIFE